MRPTVALLGSSADVAMLLLIGGAEPNSCLSRGAAVGPEHATRAHGRVFPTTLGQQSYGAWPHSVIEAAILFASGRWGSISYRSGRRFECSAQDSINAVRDEVNAWPTTAKVLQASRVLRFVA